MTDRQMLDILSTFSQATDESKPLTEGKRTVTADTAMADILGKLQQLNESAQPVTEGKMKELLGDIDELTSDEFSDKYSMSKAEAKAKFNFGDEEVNEGAEGKMPSKKHVMDMCKDGMTKKEICDMHPDCDQGKLKAMIDDCKEEMKDSEEEMDESSCGTKKKRTNESAIAEGVAQIEQRLLKEFAEFAEAKQELEEEPNEGNEFSGALAQAKKDGKDKFKVGGKEYDVNEDFDAGAPVGSKKKTKHGTLEKTAKGVKHTRDYKPDYLDLDGDGDKKEPMKKAAKDKKAKENK
jgi:hypothetical protein